LGYILMKRKIISLKKMKSFSNLAEE